MYARIQSAGRTDIGRRRESNQDHYLVADLSKSMLVQSSSLNLESMTRLYGSPQGHLMMVADGMGGHQSGNRASAMAIDFMVNHLLNYLHWYVRQDHDDEFKFMSDLKQMVRAAHFAIESEAKTRSEYKGMGTTFTMAYIVWPHMYVVHVGDTRCYIYRKNELRQLTRDHTMANQMAEKGGLNEDDMESSPWSNVLWNALGGGASLVEPEIFKQRLEVGDTLLLCSDGLNKYLKPAEIANVLSVESDPNVACRMLIDLANSRGGSDNITTIVARCDQPEDRPARTKVSAQVTLERVVGDLAGYVPRPMDTEISSNETIPTAQHEASHTLPPPGKNCDVYARGAKASDPFISTTEFKDKPKTPSHESWAIETDRSRDTDPAS